MPTRRQSNVSLLYFTFLSLDVPLAPCHVGFVKPRVFNRLYTSSRTFFKLVFFDHFYSPFKLGFLIIFLIMVLFSLSRKYSIQEYSLPRERFKFTMFLFAYEMTLSMYIYVRVYVLRTTYFRYCFLRPNFQLLFCFLIFIGRNIWSSSLERVNEPLTMSKAKQLPLM